MLEVWDEVGGGGPVGGLCYYLLPPESLGHIHRIDRSIQALLYTFLLQAELLRFLRLILLQDMDQREQDVLGSSDKDVATERAQNVTINYNAST